MKCATEGCQHQAKADPEHWNASETSGLCSACYQRWRRNGTAEQRLCVTDGCGKRLRADNVTGWCATCGRLPENRCNPLRCAEDGCDRRLQARSGETYCKSHRNRKSNGFKEERRRLFDLGVAGGLTCVLAGNDPMKRFHGFGQNLARSVYEAVHGAIPEGLHVLHGCHDGNCVNVDHLYADTAKVNAEDKTAIYELGLELLRGRGFQVRHGAVTSLPFTAHEGDRPIAIKGKHL